jgi:hypothetical protein
VSRNTPATTLILARPEALTPRYVLSSVRISVFIGTSERRFSAHQRGVRRTMRFFKALREP